MRFRHLPDAPSGEVLFHTQKPQLAILDIMLPGFDGFSLCRRLRQHSLLPILLLTARTEDTDKAIGLGIGADDYLVKPFSPIELIARIKALLRRAFNDSPRPAILGDTRLKFSPVRRLVTLDGPPLTLTPTEFEWRHVLMANSGWAFTRTHLLEKIWGYSDEAGEDTVTAHMSNLRRKLGGFAIRTVRGVGYEEDV